MEEININLIKKYNVDGPYYSSYPVLSEWSNSFSNTDYLSGLNELCAKDNTPIFLYIHFPFCIKQCYYCICNSIITYNHSVTKKYLNHISKEIDLLFNFFEKHSYTPNIKMIHLGGGSPNLMNNIEFNFLIEKIKSLTDINNLYEFAIEIDPRTVNKEKIAYYASKGINRLSFGIQDFDPYVQKAINRIQPSIMIEKLLSPEIRKLFKSVNFDILYGLPLQTKESFNKTIETVIKLSPDRITLIKYAHLPKKIRHQRLINEDALPSYVDGQQMFIEAINNLTSNGYEHVGIDHFGKSTDEMIKAKINNTLWRNFGGVSPGGTHNIIGIGPTSTSSVNNFYIQNVYSLSEYYDSIDKNKFPVLRGYKLDTDDLIRRKIINEIICYGFLKFNEIEKLFDINFNNYFETELNMLNGLITDGFILFDTKSLTVTSLGRIFIRHICKIFDKKYSKKENIYRISGP